MFVLDVDEILTLVKARDILNRHDQSLCAAQQTDCLSNSARRMPPREMIDRQRRNPFITDDD